MKKITPLFVIVIFLFGCKEQSPVPNSPEELTATPTITPRNQLNYNTNYLTGTWTSVTEVNNGRQKAIDGLHTLTLLKNGKFTSFYKPDDLKNGEWSLHQNNVIRLSLNVTNDYKIMELTDSTLKAQHLFREPDIVIVDYKKERGQNKAELKLTK